MRLCIFLHPMMPVATEPFKEYVLGPIIGFPFDTTLAVARMCFDGMLKDFPDIKWIIGHAGGAVPFLMERMDSGYRDFAETKEKIDQLPSFYLKRLYYDCVTFSPHNLHMLRDEVGSDHMLMGSDYPHLLGSIDKAVSSIESMADSSGRKAEDLRRQRPLDPEQRVGTPSVAGRAKVVGAVNRVADVAVQCAVAAAVSTRTAKSNPKPTDPLPGRKLRSVILGSR